MPHGLTTTDQMFSVRKVPWHGLGRVLEHPPSGVEEALTLSGLDWSVDQQALHTDEGLPVASLKANVRSDTREVLGVVSDRYRVVQNVDALRFADHLIGSATHYECAGSLWGGRRVFILCRLPEWISVGGDTVGQYLLLATGHDGRHGVQAAVTPVRVVCQNTLTAALGRARRTHTVRHTGSVTAKLHEARRVLELTVDYYTQFAAWGDRLALEPMGERALERVLAELYPNGTTDRSARTAGRARAAIRSLATTGTTAGNAPGSKWAALNAVVEWEDWYRPARGERFGRAALGTSPVKAKALELVSAA